jgi:tetratricopeptide (TPR) repeat protein
MHSALKSLILGAGIAFTVQAAPTATPGGASAVGVSPSKSKLQPTASLPAEVQADHQKAILALKDGKPQRAVALLSPWVKKYPQEIPLVSDYATALTRAGKFEEAREALEEALAKNDETSAAFINLREILAHQAAVSYAKALGRKPPNSQISLRLSTEPPVIVAAATPAEPVVTPSTASSSQVVTAGAGGPGPSQSTSSSVASATKSPAASPPNGQAAGPKSAAGPVAADTQVVSALEKQITQLTQKWAEVWSAKDFDGYVALYSQTFETKNHASRQAWADYRRPRVTRSGEILVELSDIRVRQLSDDQVEVRFRQRYESPNLKVNSQRSLVWHREGSQWKILREEGR